MDNKFENRTFGKTGFDVGPLGVGSSYGVGARGIEEAYERGVNYFYWAWSRRSGMRDGLRNIAKQNRDKIFITITSLAPTGQMIRHSVEKVRKALDIDYIDGLQFFLFKDKPPMRKLQLGPAIEMKEEGIIRHIGISSHYRPNFHKYHAEPFCDFFHVRYNAKHPGAENDVFPSLPPKGMASRPGIVAFTATSWKQLIKADPARLGGLATPTAGDCYRFALSNRNIDVCLTGPGNDDQMRHALDAVDKGPMSEDELDWMRKVGQALYK